METIRELYSPEEISRLEKKRKNWRLAFWRIAALARAGGVWLCFLTRTANEPQMERAAIVLSIAAGWVDLYIRRFVIAAAGHEITHARMLLETERETCEGVVDVTAERLRIRNSVSIRTVKLTDAGQARRLKVIEEKAGALAAVNGKRLRLYTANGYIAAWEAL